MTGWAAAHRGRRDNGLESERFSPVADIDPRLSDHLLDVLGLREVPAYVEPAPLSAPTSLDRLFVAAEQTTQGREIVAALAAELGITVQQDGHQFGDAASAGPRADDAGFGDGRAGDRPTGDQRAVDPLAGIDTDAEFNAIVAGLTDLDRPLGDLTALSLRPSVAAEAEAIDDEPEHYVPPPPPPLPRPAASTVLAVLLTLFGVAVIAFGDTLGLPRDFPLPAGVVMILIGTVLLVLRLRPEPRDDSEGDGAVV